MTLGQLMVVYASTNIFLVIKPETPEENMLDLELQANNFCENKRAMTSKNYSSIRKFSSEMHVTVLFSISERKIKIAGLVIR